MEKVVSEFEHLPNPFPQLMSRAQSAEAAAYIVGQIEDMALALDTCSQRGAKLEVPSTTYHCQQHR